MPPVGIEPTIPALRVRCLTTWPKRLLVENMASYTATRGVYKLGSLSFFGGSGLVKVDEFNKYTAFIPKVCHVWS